MSVDAQYFAKLFAASDDPWAFRSRWYEKHKRLAGNCIRAVRCMP